MKTPINPELRLYKKAQKSPKVRKNYVIERFQRIEVALADMYSKIERVERDTKSRLIVYHDSCMEDIATLRQLQRAVAESVKRKGKGKS
jgi:hypothetical protein